MKETNAQNCITGYVYNEINHEQYIFECIHTF